MTQAKKKTLKNTPPEEWAGWVLRSKNFHQDWFDYMVCGHYRGKNGTAYLVLCFDNDRLIRRTVQKAKKNDERIA